MKSPPQKRIKLETSPTPSIEEIPNPQIRDETETDPDREHCSICLQPIADRTVIPTCSHEFCFECLLVWTEQSRRCPLCAQTIGEYLIHHIRSKYDYQKHYLAPLRTSPRPVVALREARRHVRTRREREWGRRERRDWEEADELERAIEKRRWVYRHGLYAKHVASNLYTRYRPFPTPAQFAASSDLISRATAFLRRELRVWVGLDVEFLTTFTLSLMKSLDIRSEPAVRLLAEFLDMDSGGERVNAEQFAHELYCYLRSPYRDIAVYDTVVQYDIPADLPLPVAAPQSSRRWRLPSDSPTRSRSHSRSHNHRSPSVSPSRLSDHYHPLNDPHHSPRAYRHTEKRHRASDLLNRSPPREERSRFEERIDHRPSHSRRDLDRDGRHRREDHASGDSDEPTARQLGQRGRVPRDTAPETNDDGPQDGRPDGRDVKGKGKAPAGGSASYERMDTDARRHTDPDAIPFPGSNNHIDRSIQIFSPTSDNHASSTASIPSSAPSAVTLKRGSAADTYRAHVAESTHGPSDVSGPLSAASHSNPNLVGALTSDGSQKTAAPIRVRSRTLFDSIQKHLAANGGMRTHQSKNRGKDIGDNIDRSSLMSTTTGGDKMTSPLDGGLEAAYASNPDLSSLPQQPSDPGLGLLAAHPVFDPRRPPAESADSLHIDRHATMSAPDIMARTRARIARLKEGSPPSARSLAAFGIGERPEMEQIAGPAAITTIDGLAEQNCDPVFVTPSAIPDYPDDTADSDTPSTSTSGLVHSTSSAALGHQRAALLRKLTAEKRLHDHSVGTSDPSPANGHALVISNESVPMGVDSGNDGDRLDRAWASLPGTTPAARAAEREATLRSQAQLRIRLAAAKRAFAEQHDVDVRQNFATADCEQSEHAIGGENASREELLRAKLIQRRI